MDTMNILKHPSEDCVAEEPSEEDLVTFFLGLDTLVAPMEDEVEERIPNLMSRR